MIHPLSDVKTNKIGAGTQIWQFAVVMDGAIIGANCNINCHTFIERNVVLGDHVTIKAGVYLWEGIVIHDRVFIGPNVTFTNDKYPRSKRYPPKFSKIVINEGASIGAGAIILGGIVIGAYALVAAGAVVTKDVPDRALVLGNPAKVIGWLNVDGSKMSKVNNYYQDCEGVKWEEINGELVRI